MSHSSDSEAEAFIDAPAVKAADAGSKKPPTADGQKKKRKAGSVPGASAEDVSQKGPKKRRVATELAMSKIRDMQRADSFAESGNSSSSDNDALTSSKLSSGKLSVGKISPSASLLSAGGGLRAGKSTTASGVLRKRTSRLGDKEWEAAAKGEQRLAAVNKAIDRVYEMSLADENFELFGNDMIQCFYDVATVTGEPIRSKTLKYVEHLANRWKYTVMQEGWKDDDDIPTPSEVIDVIIGMYCMERVGIRHDVKSEVLEFMDSEGAYPAAEYFGGWDPKSGPPPLTGNIEVTSNLPISHFRSFSNSLIHAFYADRVGLSLGCSFCDIFQWLPMLRPYKAVHELDYQEYIDQCYMITHIIFTCNNWGELSLDPALFPHEYFFIRANFDIHLQQRDVHLIAEFMECLRCFGCKDDNDFIKRGTNALLALQLDNGIWDPSDEPYRTYHATMCGAQALLAHRYRGFGPGIPAITPLLLKSSRDDAMKSAEYKTEAATHRMNSDARRQIYISSLKKRCGIDETSGDSAAVDNSSSGLEWPDGSFDTRMNDLKTALRLTAKKFVSTSGSISPKVVTPQNEDKVEEMKEVETQADVDSETQRIVNELNSLAKSLQTYLRGGASQKHMEALEELLVAAKDLPITAALLQGQQVAKDIKAASKGRGGRAKITTAAGEVMSAWKGMMNKELELRQDPASTDGVQEEATSIENVDMDMVDTSVRSY